MFTQNELQIQELLREEIKLLVEQLPCDSWHKESFEETDGTWTFRFESNGASGHFYASTHGKTPREAFAQAKDVIFGQIRDWRKTRFQEIGEETKETEAATSNHNQRVLIVDDDVDLAMALEAAITQLGYTADIVTSWEDLHRKIIATHPDLILMDWQLDDHKTADISVDKASLLIGAFSSLRNQFSHHQTKVVTHSVLDNDEVKLPDNSNGFFAHIDHWKKPMPFQEVVERAAKILQSN